MTPLVGPLSYVAAAPLAAELIDAASGLKAAELSSPTAPRRTRDRSETASDTRRRLLAGAHRFLREPLTAMLRLNSDWNDRGTDVVAVRMIEQQGKALAVMADLIDSFLTISEPEVPLVVGTAPRKHHVLLIDEDRGVLGVLRIYLLCAGYRVFAAASADEALRLPRIRTSLIDIIIADLDPDDEGFAVIEKARLLLGYDVPAVLLANQASIEIRRPEPIADVSLLRKPVNIDELNTLIGKALKRPRRSRLAQLRATGGKLRHDEPSPELVR